MSQIFVSYASEDRERIQPLIEALESLGLTLWWDKKIGVGASFDIEIEQALANADCVIVVWSHNAIRSEWVRNEASYAYDHGRLVPVKFDDIEPPLAYRRTQTADLSNWSGELTDRHFVPVVGVIQEMLDATTASSNEPRSTLTTVNASPLEDSDSQPLVAVLPFANMSRDPEYEFLGDGMTDEIITLLAADSNLDVIARNTMFGYRGDGQTKRVAQELGAKYVVEGSVRVVNERVRVTVQLTDAATLSQLWSKRFDSAVEEVYDLQDDVVDAIVTGLGSEVYRAEGKRNQMRPPETLNSWGLVVRAATELGKLGSTGFDEVVDLCRKALSLDPRGVLAKALLANAISMRANWSPKEGDVNEVQKLLEEALVGANDDPLVLTYAANALAWSGQSERARQIVKRSIDLAPNIATSYGTLAWAHLASSFGTLDGDPHYREAIRYADMAISMGPRDLSLGRWYTTKAYSHLSLGEWEVALEAASTAIERMPEFASPWTVKTASLLRLDRHEEALEAANAAMTLSPSNSQCWMYLALSHMYLRNYDAAIEASKRAIAIAEGASTQTNMIVWETRITLVEVLARAGRIEEAKSEWSICIDSNPELSIDKIMELHFDTQGIQAANIC